MKNAVIYARYSSAGQREESIEDQTRECRDFAKNEGYSIIKVYADYAITGTNDNREEFQRMIKDASKKLFQAIIVYKTDRFARNRFDAAIYKKRLKDYGVKVISAKEPIPDGPGGILLESFYESAAEMFSINLTENVKRGMYGNAQKCKANCQPSFGYKINKQTRFYEIEEQQAKIVKKIFKMAAAGCAVKDIHDYVTKQGYKKQFSWITKILTNRRYIGTYIFGKVEIPDGMPKIIDQETFQKVQQVIKKRKHIPSAKPETYLLTGKLFCGYCKNHMNGEYAINKVKNKYKYYNCTAHKKGNCQKKPIQVDRLEQIVLKAIKADILNKKTINNYADQVVIYQTQHNEDERECKYLRSQLEATNKKLNNMVKAIESGIITNTTKKRLDELEKTSKQLQKEIAEKQINSTRLTKKEIVEYMLSFKSFDIQNPKEAKILIDTFVNEIYVYDNHIDVTYRTEKDDENPERINNLKVFEHRITKAYH